MTDRSNFPTDRYVLEGRAAARGLAIRWLDPDPVEGPQPLDVAAVLDGDVALVTLSHVNYRSAAIAAMAAINSLARDAGALTLWDLSHSAGAVAIDLEGSGTDLAVGCTYKYLNGGPGAPAYLYIRGELQDRLRTPIQGWFGQRDQFAMGQGFEPAPGIRGWLAGAPPVLSLSAVDEGIRLVAEAGIDAAFLGRPLTILTTMLGPMLISVGCVYGVHVVGRYEEEAEVASYSHAAALATLEPVRLPVRVSGATTLIGFGANLLTDVPAVFELGAFSLIGVASMTLQSSRKCVCDSACVSPFRIRKKWRPWRELRRPAWP